MNPPDQCSSPEARRSRRDPAPRGGVCATHMDGGGSERVREVDARGWRNERGKRGGEKELTRACIRVYEVVHERVHHLHIVAPLSANDSSTGDGVCVPFRGGRIRVYVRIYVYIRMYVGFSDLRVDIGRRFF